MKFIISNKKLHFAFILCALCFKYLSSYISKLDYVFTDKENLPVPDFLRKDQFPSDKIMVEVSSQYYMQLNLFIMKITNFLNKLDIQACPMAKKNMEEACDYCELYTNIKKVIQKIDEKTLHQHDTKLSSKSWKHIKNIYKMFQKMD